MRDLATKTAVCIALLIAAASGAWAQGLTFTRPAATPRTEVACSTCPPANSSFGRRSVGYDGAISKFVGRFLDSTFTGDYQSAPRTIRAQQIKYDARRKRFYMQFGGGLVVSYDAVGLINRLGAGAPMTIVSANRPGALTLEKYLPYDTAFYAETDGWSTPIIDGQEFLKGIDFDDRGNVYLAYTVFGWGIVRDTTSTVGGQGLMQSLAQVTQPANQVFSVKTADGKYYALVASGQLRTGVWDVTDPANPVEVRALSRLFYSLTRSSDGRYVAGIDASDGKVHIFTAEALVNGLASFSSHAVPNAARAWVSLTAGANNDFYALEQGPNAAVRILHVAVNNLSATPTLMTTNVTMQATKVNYGDGFLTIVGSDANNQYDLRVFRLTTPSTLSEVEMTAYVSPTPAPQANLGTRTSYFTRFYADVPQHSTTPYAKPENIRFDDGIVYKHTDGRTYLIAGLKGLGDVYEIKGADGITLNYKGITGTVNPFSAQPAGTDPVYGDTLLFGSTFNAAAAFNVTWNFDNPGNSGNVRGTLAGADISHQYGMLTAADLATPRNVTVTHATDAAVNDHVQITLKAPVARTGIQGTTQIFTGTASMADAPIIVGDNFVDASDGRVESHFVDWVVDGAATRRTPSTPLPVGACGTHTLVMNANYGPYSATTAGITQGPSILTAYYTSQYTVRPFVGAIGIQSSDATNITFVSQSRQTSDFTAMPNGPSSLLTHKWWTENAAGVVVHELAPATTTLAAIPAYVVPKTVFSAPGMKVKLSLFTTQLGTACASLGSTTASTVALNPPDPVLVATGCNYTGQPCTVTVNNANPANGQSGWTYAWTLNGVAQPTATTNTFTPSIPAAGQYLVGLTASNAIGTVAATALPLNIAVPPCTGTPTQSNISVGFDCGTGACTSSNRTVRFHVYTWGYAFNPTCDVYSWNFGDGSTSNQREPSHTYAQAGTYNATFTITNGATSVSYPLPVTFVTSGGGGGNTGGGGGNTGTCLVMQQNSVFITYQGPATGCSAVSTANTPCSTGESVAFGVSEFGYNLGCGTHTYQWSFGDNQTSNLGRNVSHQYAAPGTYNVSVTVTPPSGIGVTVTQPVTVGGGSTGGGNCAVPQSNNFVIGMSGSVSGCSANQRNCFTTDNIAFNINPTGAYNISCGTHSYTWNFGDGTGGSGQAPSHRYNANGTYTVTATVQNTAGQAVVALAGTITVTTPSGGGSCPVPTNSNLFITFNGPSGCSQSNAKPCEGSELVRLQVDPYLYNFNCGTHSFTWTFGDGTTGSGRIVDHSFAPSASPYNVQVTVNNGSGQITLSQPVTVTSGGGTGNPGGVTPTVGFTSSTFPSLPNGMMFTPTVSPAGSVNRWVWNFGDGSEATATGTTPTPQIHPYAAAGTYTVTLSTFNGATAFPTVSHTVVVGGGTTRQRPTRRN